MQCGVEKLQNKKGSRKASSLNGFAARSCRGRLKFHGCWVEGEGLGLSLNQDGLAGGGGVCGYQSEVGEGTSRLGPRLGDLGRSHPTLGPGITLRLFACSPDTPRRTTACFNPRPLRAVHFRTERSEADRRWGRFRAYECFRRRNTCPTRPLGDAWP